MCYEQLTLFPFEENEKSKELLKQEKQIVNYSIKIGK